MLRAGDTVAGWGRFLLFRRDRRAALRWAGTPLVLGGAIGFVAWLVAKGMVATKVEGVVNRSKALPSSLRTIMTDVSGEVISGVTPAFWIPSLAVLGLGVVLVLASFAVRRGQA